MIPIPKCDVRTPHNTLRLLPAEDLDLLLYFKLTSAYPMVRIGDYVSRREIFLKNIDNIIQFIINKLFLSKLHVYAYNLHHHHIILQFIPMMAAHTLAGLNGARLSPGFNTL